MKYAIVSDIHSNWTAWCAARDRAWKAGADVLICLGDMVGYGPSPARVIRDVREQVSLFVMGNHEAALVGQMPLDSFTATARRSVAWTRRRVDQNTLKFLRDLPMALELEDMSLVHAESPDPAAFGYVDDAEDAAACFRANESRLTFIGHTHVPIIYILSPDGTLTTYEGDRIELMPDHRYLVNVGSVGDPRDGSTDSSFAIYDADRGVIELQRVPIPLDEFRREWAAASPPMPPPFFLRISSIELGAACGKVFEHALVAPKTSRLFMSGMPRSVPARLTIADLTRLRATPARASTSEQRRRTPRWEPHTVRERMLVGLAIAGFIGLGLAGLLRTRHHASRSTSVPEPPSLPPVRDVEPRSPAAVPLEEVARAAQRGEVILLAERAELNGSAFRFECMMSRTNIGFWFSPDDVAVWRFRLPNRRRFDVEIEYALAPAGNGNQVFVGIGREKFVVPLPSTGGWSNYVRRTLGQIQANAGLNILEIRPASRPKSGLMNLREVRLIPRESADSNTATVNSAG